MSLHMKPNVPLFLFLAAIGVAAHAEPTTPLAWSTSSLSLDTKTADACLPTVLEKYVRYAVVRVPAQPAPWHQLIVQRFEVGSGCFEGFRPARALISAKTVDVRTGKTGDKPLWSFETEGIFGEIAPWPASGLYRVDMPGCCGAAKTEKFYSLQTGKLVAASTSALLSFEEPKDRALRFVAVEDSIASSPQGQSGALATVFFGDVEDMREAVAITADAGAGRRGWSAEIAWKGQENGTRHLVPTALPGATLEITLQCQCDVEPVNIEIPVSAEGLDEAKAKVSGLPGIVLTKKGRDAEPQRTVVAAPASEATAESVVQAFLQYLLRPKTNIALDAPAQKRWLTAALRRQMAETTAAVKAGRKSPEADGPDPALPDNGVFLDSWDYPSACRVTPAPAGRSQVQIEVVCEWGLRTNYPGATRTASVSLVREEGAWRVADIVWHKNKYAAEMDVAKELDALKSQGEEFARRGAAPPAR